MPAILTECVRKRDEIRERAIVSTGPPRTRPLTRTAPSEQRVPPIGILVRLDDGEAAGRVPEAFAERLVSSGHAESFRKGWRRYLRLRPGVVIRASVHGWEFVEEQRRQYGDYAVRRGLASLDRRPLKWEPPQDRTK